MELISKDDGGEEVEQMPEIDLSSDSEGEVQCIDPPTFYDPVGSIKGMVQKMGKYRLRCREMRT